MSQDVPPELLKIVPGTVGAILVKARSENLLGPAEEEIKALLNQRHRITNSKEPDFSTRNLSEILAIAEQSSKAMSLLLGAVACHAAARRAKAARPLSGAHCATPR